MCFVDSGLASGHLQHNLDLLEQVLGEVLAVVDLNAIRTPLLERREEALGLRLVDGLRRSGSPPFESKCNEGKEHNENQYASWAAQEAGRQHVQRRHAEVRCGRVIARRSTGAGIAQRREVLRARGGALGHRTAGRRCGGVVR